MAMRPESSWLNRGQAARKRASPPTEPLLRVDNTLRRAHESTAGPDTPMYVQRFCAWPKQQCQEVFRCAYGQGHFDTRGLMKLGFLLSKWYLKQGWCKDCL